MEHIVNILESFLGEHRKYNEEKGQVSFDCPACSNDRGLPEGDGKGNLEVNYYKDRFRCWACEDVNDMHGGVTKLIKRFGNLRILADYRLMQPEKTFEEREIKLLSLPEGTKFLKDCSSKDFKYSRAMFYLLKERGITQDIIQDFDIGFTTIGQHHNRIIIPSYDNEGNLNYFIARWFDKQYNKLKYLNPEAKKQEIIFNEYKINWDATIYLVEGAFDHIVVPNSIPLLGKTISDVLLFTLHEKAKAKIVILLDNDAYTTAKKLYAKVNFGNLKDRVRLCKLPEDYDPSKIFKDFGNNGILSYLKHRIKLKENLIF